MAEPESEPSIDHALIVEKSTAIQQLLTFAWAKLELLLESSNDSERTSHNGPNLKREIEAEQIRLLELDERHDIVLGEMRAISQSLRNLVHAQRERASRLPSMDARDSRGDHNDSTLGSVSAFGDFDHLEHLLSECTGVRHSHEPHHSGIRDVSRTARTCLTGLTQNVDRMMVMLWDVEPVGSRRLLIDLEGWRSELGAIRERMDAAATAMRNIADELDSVQDNGATCALAVSNMSKRKHLIENDNQNGLEQQSGVVGASYHRNTTAIASSGHGLTDKKVSEHYENDVSVGRRSVRFAEPIARIETLWSPSDPPAAAGSTLAFNCCSPVTGIPISSATPMAAPPLPLHAPPSSSIPVQRPRPSPLTQELPSSPLRFASLDENCVESDSREALYSQSHVSAFTLPTFDHDNVTASIAAIRTVLQSAIENNDGEAHVRVFVDPLMESLCENVTHFASALQTERKARAEAVAERVRVSDELASARQELETVRADVSLKPPAGWQALESRLAEETGVGRRESILEAELHVLRTQLQLAQNGLIAATSREAERPAELQAAPPSKTDISSHYYQGLKSNDGNATAVVVNVIEGSLPSAPNSGRSDAVGAVKQNNLSQAEPHIDNIPQSTPQLAPRVDPTNVSNHDAGPQTRDSDVSKTSMSTHSQQVAHILVHRGPGDVIPQGRIRLQAIPSPLSSPAVLVPSSSIQSGAASNLDPIATSAARHVPSRETHVPDARAGAEAAAAIVLANSPVIQQTANQLGRPSGFGDGMGHGNVTEMRQMARAVISRAVKVAEERKNARHQRELRSHNDTSEVKKAHSLLGSGPPLLPADHVADHGLASDHHHTIHPPRRSPLSVVDANTSLNSAGQLKSGKRMAGTSIMTDKPAALAATHHEHGQTITSVSTNTSFDIHEMEAGAEFFAEALTKLSHRVPV